MAHAQKPDLLFQRNGRVHLYRRGCQFSRLLAVEVCTSAVVMLDRPCSDTVHECWLPPPFAFFPFTSPPVRFRVPSDSVSTLPQLNTNYDDYIVQLDGAPPSPHFHRNVRVFSIVFFNSAGSDVLQKETTNFSLGHPVRRI